MKAKHFRGLATGAGILAPFLLAACATAGVAQPVVAEATAPEISYADLADLTEAAAIIARAEIREQATVDAERAPGLAPGHARLYIEADTQALLKGPAAVGESLAYLVDVPLDSRGKPPKLKKQSVLLFADPVPGRPGELQLVAPDAQFAASTSLDARVRAVIAELAASDAPPRVVGLRDVISVQGNLVGESETQLFIETASGAPVSMTIIRRPGMQPEWGISWSEIVDQSASAPARGTLEWYRLACALPSSLPEEAFLQEDREARQRARADYQYVLDQLGPCGRTRFEF